MAQRYGVFPLRLRASVHDTILPYGRLLNIAAGVYISSRRCQDAHWDISTNTGDDSDRVTSSIIGLLMRNAVNGVIVGRKTYTKMHIP